MKRTIKIAIKTYKKQEYTIINPVVDCYGSKYNEDITNLVFPSMQILQYCAFFPTVICMRVCNRTTAEESAL